MKYFSLEKSPIINYLMHIILPIHSVYNSSESVSYLGTKIWELIPPVIRQIDTFTGFKKVIKKWKLTNCPCRICKT